MKKIFYLASIAALAFSSCAKDETTEAQINAVNGGAKITAAMAADDTRTSLEKVDGKYEFRWSAGDQLGVYGVGENTLNNAAFVLENASDGKAVGVFASQNVELKADQDYVAVYPRFQTSLFSNIDLEEVELNVPGTKGEEQDDYVDLTAVKVTIPAKQKYQNGTFYTQTVPAVSTEFFVNADGGANLSMQPVVDYLFVNIQSTEPIKTLKLQLNDNKAKKMLKLAGTAALTRYELGNNFRYYVNQKNLQDNAIILETDESYATVTCHEANTYVFAIPGGILGMGGDIEALITVNDDTNYTFKAVGDRTPDGKTIESNKGINFGGAKFDVVRKKDSEAVLPYENTIFWMNSISVDTDGDKKADARGSFVYNPNGDVIIENEAQLLEYITEYNNTNPKFHGHDAFLCEDATFDFSIQNMMELATEYKNTKYEPYIAAYLADDGGFPCFGYLQKGTDGVWRTTGGQLFKNNFIGNGAVIENIEQPLLSWAGIFGGYDYTTLKLTGIIPVGATRGGEFVETKDGESSITNVTFSNIVAKSGKAYDDDYALSHGMILEYTCRGHVLAGLFDGTIKNVTVKNANGESIMGKMSVAQYNGMDIEGVSKLDNIANNLWVESSLDLTETWAEVSGVKESVFNNIKPQVNAKGENALHVITLAEGDASTYAKLTDKVDISTPSAVAVLIDEVSYWTGDSFKPSKDLKDADKNVIGKYVRYAEELAYNGLRNDQIELTSDMDLNFANLQWDNDDDGYIDQAYYWNKRDYAAINGADHTVKGVVMRYNTSPIAPFSTPVVKNLTMDGININLSTNTAEENVKVPEYIAGLTFGDFSKDVVISDVTVNNLVIDTYRYDGTNNSEANYSDQYSSKIGWLVAKAHNAQITNATVNGVKSTVKGIAGLVAENTITTSSKFDNVEVLNIDAVNTSLEAFAQYKEAYKAAYNVMGTAVGLVVNNAGRKADIKFMNCDAPVFLYNAPQSLTVIYDNVEKGSLKNK